MVECKMAFFNHFTFNHLYIQPFVHSTIFSMPNNRIVILGGGESGAGAALLAKAKGFEVFLSDKGKLQDSYRQILTNHQIPFEEETHTEALILNATEVIKSPGIPDKAEMVQKLKARNIPIISEIEFAARYTQAKLIAITGSNGKTTTTLLTYHLLQEAGLKVGLAGNVGKSFAELVIEDNFDWYVLEVSSFQLDNCYLFRPHISILTNITPDHLDRYNYLFQNYIDSKFRIIQHQLDNDYFIYYKDDPVIAEELRQRVVRPHEMCISLQDSSQSVGYYSEADKTLTIQNTSVSMEGLPLRGKHNALNILAASLAAMQACKEANVPLPLRQGLLSFQNAPHRLEPAGTIHDILFINDSKATNVDSVFYALGSFETEPVIWIAGGVDKGNDYTQIEDLVKQKVKLLICLGKDNEKLVSFFSDLVPEIRQTQSIEEAVRMGIQAGKPGDVVLLSPACASFDLFRNYEDRGEQFKAAVKKLSES